MLARPVCALLPSIGKVVKADVFIQNLKPGSMEKLGFGEAALRARYPYHRTYHSPDR
jgi:crotonobetainyl-CoA:carnitine CoA-transferase CaiB-like acyl-CoA transferase